MMSNRDEQAALARTETLARARDLCKAWGYWCTRTHIRTGFEPYMSTGGIERYYRAPPQWHPPEPRMPDADENVGLAVQKAYVKLPQVYRLALRAEFYMRPWIIGLTPDEVLEAVARKARQSVGQYPITLDRSLLALANVMKRHGLWRAA